MTPEREQELLALIQALEAKVYHATDRAAQTRESVVKMRDKLRVLRERLAERDQRIETLESLRAEDQTHHNGYIEGLKEALRLAIESRPPLASVQPLTAAEIKLDPQVDVAAVAKEVERILRTEARRGGVFIDHAASSDGAIQL